MNTAIPIIILAAGNSSRLGHPKQLVPYRKHTLLSYTVHEALATNQGEVVVVLGAHEEEIQKTIQDATVISNKYWQEGMGSSIVAGVSYLMEKGAEGVVLLLCDQPYVTTELIRKVINGGMASGIAVCDYGESSGPPAYFSKHYFPELMALKGDHGARQVVKKYKEQLCYISFPKGRHDIDTAEDLKILS